MSDAINYRLNQILPKITSEDFLRGKGISGEIVFYIFDYQPEYEMIARRHIDVLLEHIPLQRPGTKVCHINLFKLLVDYLKEKNLLEKSFEMQRTKGNLALLKALKGILNEEKIAAKFIEIAKPKETDLIIISGVGSSYPLLRSHTLLNNLHAHAENTPVIMFYPGHFDKITLRLFGKTGLLGDETNESPATVNYYRAFKLIE